jgi:hypothetical protein
MNNNEFIKSLPTSGKEELKFAKKMGLYNETLEHTKCLVSKCNKHIDEIEKIKENCLNSKKQDPLCHVKKIFNKNGPHSKKIKCETKNCSKSKKKLENKAHKLFKKGIKKGGNIKTKKLLTKYKQNKSNKKNNINNNGLNNKEYLESLDKDEKKQLTKFKKMGNANIFIDLNKCIKHNCNETNNKIKKINDECYGNNKRDKKSFNCYINKVFKTKLFHKQSKCIKKNKKSKMTRKK